MFVLYPRLKWNFADKTGVANTIFGWTEEKLTFIPLWKANKQTNKTCLVKNYTDISVKHNFVKKSPRQDKTEIPYLAPPARLL